MTAINIPHLDGQCNLSIPPCSWIRTGPLITCLARLLLLSLLWPEGSSPGVALSFSFSIFLSRLVHFFLGGLSKKQLSASRLMVDDPPPLSPGEGGPLNEMSRDGVLFVEEQREELLLVSWSSVVLAVVTVMVVDSLLVLRCPSRVSLSALLELWTEEISWRSGTSHKDKSWGSAGLSDKRQISMEESRRRHRCICMS